MAARRDEKKHHSFKILPSRMKEIEKRKKKEQKRKKKSKSISVNIVDRWALAHWLTNAEIRFDGPRTLLISVMLPMIKWPPFSFKNTARHHHQSQRINSLHHSLFWDSLKLIHLDFWKKKSTGNCLTLFDLRVSSWSFARYTLIVEKKIVIWA